MAIPNIYTFLVFFVSFLGFMSSSNGLQLAVGGKDGWGPNPSENYNRWAERLRFQVNDTLLFKYKKGSDSVLVVNKDDYDHCNTANPKEKLDDGDSIFEFDRSGPFFFISGNKIRCSHGQKLIVVVLAVRSSHPQSPPPSEAPSPAPLGGDIPSLAPEDGQSANSTTPHRSFAAAPAEWGLSAMVVLAVSVVINAGLAV